MTDLLKSSSDRALLTKSVLVGCAIAALLLAGMRHEPPKTSSDRSDGGRVLLLLPSKENDRADRAAFARWRELNLPSRIFGYESSGLFAALFPRKSMVAAPPVFSSRPVSAFTPLLTLPEYPVPGRAGELVFSEVPLPAPASGGAEKVPLVSGAVVYDEAGRVLLRLPDLRGDAALRGPLMVRAGKALAGTEFRIVGSSGSTAFDRSALENLERHVRQGGSFSGILTVWGDGRGTK